MALSSNTPDNATIESIKSFLIKKMVQKTVDDVTLCFLVRLDRANEFTINFEKRLWQGRLEDVISIRKEMPIAPALVDLFEDANYLRAKMLYQTGISIIGGMTRSGNRRVCDQFCKMREKMVFHMIMKTECLDVEKKARRL